MRPGFRAFSLLVGPALLVLSACASTTAPATVIRTVYDPQQQGFRNFLVISVAGEYGSRAALERELVAGIARGNISATAYYTVVGRNPQLTRAYLHDAIRARGFDAILFVRQKGQEQKELAPLRPVGAALDLFGYDYSELNRDVRLQQSAAITFVSEVYDATAQHKVWAIESLSFDKATAAELITEQAQTIAAQLRDDRLLAR